jgi:exosome complex component RRP43
MAHNMPTADMQMFATMHYKEVLRRFTRQNVRPDGRSLSQYRIQTVSAENSVASGGLAISHIGRTRVMCSIHLERSPPESEHRIEAKLNSNKTGRVRVQVDVGACASGASEHKAARARESAIAAFLTNILVGTEVLDLSQLILADGQVVFVLCIDVMCLSDDGNLYDASLTAVIAALRSSRFLTQQLTETNTLEIVANSSYWCLNMHHHPIALTVGLFEGLFLHDCTRKEEEELDGSLSIVYNEYGKLCGVHKPGGVAIGKEMLKACMMMSSAHARQTFEMLARDVPIPALSERRQT